MTTELSLDARPILANSYVARPQADACLLYHVRTDELYLVPHSGYFVMQLCDGRNSIRDIVAIAQPLFSSDGGEFADRVLRFLGNLAAKGILDGSRG